MYHLQQDDGDVAIRSLERNSYAVISRTLYDIKEDRTDVEKACQPILYYFDDLLNKYIGSAGIITTTLMPSNMNAAASKLKIYRLNKSW